MKFETIFTFIRGKISKYKIAKTKPNRVSYYSLDKSGCFNKKKSIYASRKEKGAAPTIYDSVEDAEHIVEDLNKIIHKNGIAFLAEYKDRVGLSTLREDWDFGWISDIQYRIDHYAIDCPPYHKYILRLGNAKRF